MGEDTTSTVTIDRRLAHQVRRILFAYGIPLRERRTFASRRVEFTIKGPMVNVELALADIQRADNAQRAVF